MINHLRLTLVERAFGGIKDMAIEDFGGNVLGKPVELVFTDTQNKPDIASARARQWFDADGVDMVTDPTSSNIALAISKLAEEKNGHGAMNELGQQVEAAADVKLIAAAVSGGATGAQAGTLSIMASGPEDHVEVACSYFDAVGSNTFYYDAKLGNS